MRPEKCIGNCGRDIAVGQTIFQVYGGGYWSAPYITPDPSTFLGNWCVDCFELDYREVISRQEQPYKCAACGRGFKKDELVIYATYGTRPAPPAQRAQIRGAELHLIVCKECRTDVRFAKLNEMYERESCSTELERVLKRLKGDGAGPMVGHEVRHPDFGIGTVVGVDGYNDDRRISVNFPGRGIKKLVERYAQLEWL
jgi:hypothetical protein